MLEAYSKAMDEAEKPYWATREAMGHVLDGDDERSDQRSSVLADLTDADLMHEAHRIWAVSAHRRKEKAKGKAKR